MTVAYTNCTKWAVHISYPRKQKIYSPIVRADKCVPAKTYEENIMV